jgi:heparin/heparan-sulfate lyase
MEEPRISETGVSIDRTEYGQKGRLVLNTLVPEPENRSLVKIGGPGKEYWVFGRNFANDQDPGRLQRGSMELGEWRIQISPRKASDENILLNVMQVTDRQSNQTFPVETMDAGPVVGCRIDAPQCHWVVLFRKDGRRSDGSFTFPVPGKKPCRVLITDLEEGAWEAKQAGGETIPLLVTPPSFAACFSGQAGNWFIARTSDE